MIRGTVLTEGREGIAESERMNRAYFEPENNQPVFTSDKEENYNTFIVGSERGRAGEGIISRGVKWASLRVRINERGRRNEERRQDWMEEEWGTSKGDGTAMGLPEMVPSFRTLSLQSER